MEMKYVRHEIVGFVVWPAHTGLQHSDVADVINTRTHAPGIFISAGFCYIKDEKAVCYGKSVSMNLDSKPSEDSERLTKQLFG